MSNNAADDGAPSFEPTVDDERVQREATVTFDSEEATFGEAAANPQGPEWNMSTIYVTDSAEPERTEAIEMQLIALQETFPNLVLDKMVNGEGASTDVWELEGGEDADAKDGADTTYDDAVPNGFFEAEIVIIDVEDLERWGTLAYAIGIRTSRSEHEQSSDSSRKSALHNQAMTRGTRHAESMLDGMDARQTLILVRADEVQDSQFVLGFARATAGCMVLLLDGDMERTLTVDGARTLEWLVETPDEGRMVPLTERIISTINNMNEGIMMRRRAELISRITAIKGSTEPQNRVGKLRECVVAFFEQAVDDPGFLSPDYVLPIIKYLKSYELYSDIIEMVQRWKGFSDANPTLPHEYTGQCLQNSVRIHYLFAEALAKQKPLPDAPRALRVLNEDVIPLSADYNAVEAHSLVGRVYKDRWKKNLEDLGSLTQAIESYRKAYSLAQARMFNGEKGVDVVFPGINLATLLVAHGQIAAGGDEKAQQLELLSLSTFMLANIGNQGSMSQITNYWDAATLFELYFLTRKLARACRAAFVMQAMVDEPWMVMTTLSNVQIIKAQAQDVEMHDESYAVLQFWFWYFETSAQPPPDATKEHSATDKIRWPALLAERELPGKRYHPVSVELTPEDCHVCITNVTHAHDQLHDAVAQPMLSVEGTTEILNKWEFVNTDIRMLDSINPDTPRKLVVSTATQEFELLLGSAAWAESLAEHVRQLFSNNEYKVNRPSEGARSEAFRFKYDLDTATGWKKELGRGAFGHVYSAIDLSTGMKIAVKEVDFVDEEAAAQVQSEIELQKGLYHPHIVRYLGSEVGLNTILVFMEQVPHGVSLIDLVKAWEPLRNQPRVFRDYSYQILRGLAYLHDRPSPVVHLDIKGDNVLVDRFNGIVKLTDFGVSKQVKSLFAKPAEGDHNRPDEEDDEDLVGTPRFQSPEVIQQLPGCLAPPADIWSFGSLMVEIASGEAPFPEYEVTAAVCILVVVRREHPTIPEELDPGAQNFIKQCFKYDPTDRPDATQLLTNPWISNTQVPSFGRSKSNMSSLAVDAEC